MAPTLPDLHELAQQLPELCFVAQDDCQWPQHALVQAYLNAYGINFAQQFTAVTHGFGCVNTAEFRIATHYWLPETPIGTLVVVHGYYDHVGVFAHPIRFALEHNLAVLAFDLPGHGLSSGEPAVIDSFNQYGDVLAEILRRSVAIMRQPLYALGQSTGCAVLMNYMWRYAHTRKASEQFTKLALCSPLVLSRTWRGYRMGRFVYAILRHFIQRIPRSFGTSSHDAHFNHFIQLQDPLQANYVSLRWIGAMKAWHELLQQCTPLQNALLIVQGTGDLTVDWPYNVLLIKRKLPNTHIVYVQDAGHQLVNENDYYRNQVFAAIKHYFFN